MCVLHFKIKVIALSTCTITYQFKKAISLGVLLLFSSYIWSQQDIGRSEIDTIFINADALRHSSLEQDLSWTEKQASNLGSTDLGSFLSRSSNIFVKSYGANSLSTASIRGGNASHVSILWNGIPIESPSLGLTDLSLFPTSFFDKISVSKGGQSSLAGSGAISGVIQLDNIAPTVSETEFGITQGSFGLSQYNFGLSTRLKNLNFRIKLLDKRADNDFEYELGGNGIEKRVQSNNRSTQQAGLAALTWLIKPNKTLDIRHWIHNAYRQIPPTSTQNRSLAEQYDKGHRSSASYKSIGNNNVVQISLAHIHEINDYNDELILVQAKNRFNRWIGNVDYSYRWNQSHKISAGFNFSQTHARSTSFTGAKNRNELAIYARLASAGNKKISYAVDGRLQSIDGVITTPLFNTGIKYYLDQFTISANMSRDFRFPTLNDLYWSPGGNLDLQPETGWSQDLGIAMDNDLTSWSINFFNRLTDNWIYWTPIEGSFIFSPQNIAKVWSRGLEMNLEQNLGLLTLALNYSYVKSTNQVEIKIPLTEKGAQLIYVPLHQLHLSGNLTTKLFNIGAIYNYNSQTLTLAENLDSYMTIDMWMARSFKIKTIDIDLSVNINNLLDEQYRVIERRPMPGRNLSVSAKIKL